MKFLCLFICWYTLLFPSKAQSLIPVSSQKVGDIQGVSIDRTNNFYISLGNGSIQKYDINGEHLLTFSPQKQAGITLFEAWQAVRTFIFYRDLQQYQFLGRFLVSSPYLDISNGDIGFVRLATLGSDNTLWLIDDTDLSLKKYDPDLNKVVINTPFYSISDDISSINFIREYQNLVFMNDPNRGILVFDNLGNFDKSISIPGISYFNFLKDEIYFLSGDELVFMDIYKSTERKITIPSPKGYKFALVAPGTVALFSDETMDLFRLIP